MNLWVSSTVVVKLRSMKTNRWNTVLLVILKAPFVEVIEISGGRSFSTLSGRVGSSDGVGCVLVYHLICEWWIHGISPATLRAVGVKRMTSWGPPHLGWRDLSFQFLTKTWSPGCKGFKDMCMSMEWGSKTVCHSSSKTQWSDFIWLWRSIDPAS